MSKSWILCSLLFVVACSKKEEAKPQEQPKPEAKPEAKTAPAVAPAKAQRDVTPCPPEKELKELAADLFELKADEKTAKADRVSEMSCLAFWSENTSWWLFYGQVQDAEFMTHTVAATRAAAFAKPAWSPEHATEQTRERYEAVDLDGNGDDEILQYTTDGNEGVAWEKLTIHTVSQGDLEKVSTVPIRYENTGAVETKRAKQLHTCLSEVKVNGRVIEVKALARQGKPEEASCPKTATYTFDGKALTEKVAAR